MNLHRSSILLLGSAALLLAGAGLHAALAPLLRQEPVKAGAQHQVLQQMVGDWDAEVNMGGPPSKASQTVKSMPGGMFVMGDMSADFGGMPFHGHGVWGYDQRKNKYVGLWVDNFDSSLQLQEGTYDEKTKTLTLDGESVGMDGKPAIYHYVTKFTGKDSFDFELSVTPKAGGTTMPMGSVHYTRKK